VRLLLDTHVLLWAVAASRRLPKSARALIQDQENEVFYSAASVWEVSIKAGLRRSDFEIDVEQFHASLPQAGFSEMPVRAAHSVAVSKLPGLHRDPFDRMLVAQALLEPLVLVTNDEFLAKYPAPVRMI
jgi:PIN domain nuclease of toxin-antitoxin system